MIVKAKHPRFVKLAAKNSAKEGGDSQQLPSFHKVPTQDLLSHSGDGDSSPSLDRLFKVIADELDFENTTSSHENEEEEEESSSGQKHVFKCSYQDAEGDCIVISSYESFQMALEDCVESSLKVYVECVHPLNSSRVSELEHDKKVIYAQLAYERKRADEEAQCHTQLRHQVAQCKVDTMVFNERYLKLQAEKDKCQDQIQGLETKVTSLKQYVASLEADKTHVCAQLEEKVKYVAELETQVTSLQEVAAVLLAEKQQAQKQRDDAEQASNAKISEMQMDMFVLATEKSQAEKERNDVESAWDSKISDMQSAMFVMEAEKKQAQKERNQAEQACHSKIAEMQAATSKKIAGVNQAHQWEIAKLRKHHAEAQRALREKVEVTKQTFQKQFADCEDGFHKQRLLLQKELMSLRQKHAQKQTTHSDIMSKIQTQLAKAMESSHGLLEDYRKKIQRMEKQQQQQQHGGNLLFSSEARCRQEEDHNIGVLENKVRHRFAKLKHLFDNNNNKQ